MRDIRARYPYFALMRWCVCVDSARLTPSGRVLTAIVLLLSCTLGQTAMQDLEGDWQNQYATLRRQLANREWFERIAHQAFRRDALILPGEQSPSEVILRRTTALLTHLAPSLAPSVREGFEKDLNEFAREVANTRDAGRQEEGALFMELCRLRRSIVLANPKLCFDDIVFLKSRFPKLQHCCYQYYGRVAVPGGGLYRLSGAFDQQPRVDDLLADAVVASGRLAGRRLDHGSFMSLSLSCDASEIYFSHTECNDEAESWRRDSSPWKTDRCWHVFKLSLHGSTLEQLTDGPWNEFDPWPLPNGRLVFLSERRGGFGRCHTVAMPVYTLHSMRRDGTDIVPLSYHESNEWHPSVNNDGMVVYTRWDYVDRGDCIAHHPWITYPDGRDPRAIHGNYPIERRGRPDMELHVRAIPGSHKYVATAAGHHRLAYGSLVVIDPRIEDDGAMSPVRRLTPEVPFPESEEHVNGYEERRRQVYIYGTAWPLDETFYLCAHAPGGKDTLGIYVMDAFGNRELLYRDPDINCLHPVPLHSRQRPPVLSHGTTVGLPGTTGSPDPTGDEEDGATIACVNVYSGALPWPPGVQIRSLRVIQLFPRTEFHMDQPMVGLARESLARGVLGTVPVEPDGSVRFLAPTGRALYFQALDEEGCAVQSMMSATYVHPGETLTCQGCHEPRPGTPEQRDEVVMAFKRAPSEIEPDVDGSYPLSFARLVQPVLDRHCVSCHRQNQGRKAPSLSGEASGKFDWSRSYVSLSAHAYGLSGKPPDRQPVRTYPGNFGARASDLYRMLRRGHHEVELSVQDLHRIVLWLDCNSNFFGAYHDIDKQLRGELVMPRLD